MHRTVRGIALIGSIAGLASAAGPACGQTAPDSISRVTGSWLGALALEIPFRVHLTVIGSASGLSATVDFPDQNARGLPLTEIRLVGDSLHFRLAPADIAFAGRVIAGDSIVGVFAQGDQRFPLILRRAAPEQAHFERPQEPKLPYPYRTEAVTVVADSGVVLAGTLTIPEPEGRYAAILLIPGSGPLDRDASVAGHRPFHVLADRLTRQGYAVLRYAKRGVPRSSGDFASATTADLADDAAAIVRYLRERSDVDGDRIALIGHSEGALVAAMVAAQDHRVATAVLFGAPGLRGDSLMIVRAAAILAERGVPQHLISRDAALRRAIVQAITSDGSPAEARARLHAAIEQELQQLTSADLSTLGYSVEAWESGIEVYLAQLAWFRYWFPLDPIPLYGRMHGPVLALFGGLDWQVPPALNAPPVRVALGSRNYTSTIEELPAVNHQMQTATTGSPEEYGRITETVALAVLDRIARWLAEHLLAVADPFPAGPADVRQERAPVPVGARK